MDCFVATRLSAQAGKDGKRNTVVFARNEPAGEGRGDPR